METRAGVIGSPILTRAPTYCGFGRPRVAPERRPCGSRLSAPRRAEPRLRSVPKASDSPSAIGPPSSTTIGVFIFGRIALAGEERPREQRRNPDGDHGTLVRTGSEVKTRSGRDHWWHELMAGAPPCPAEPMDSEHPLFILYTSGSTGKPKGIAAHDAAGTWSARYATTKLVFDLKDDDVYWCTADIGWVTGHSYVVYGPLANGATALMYEGAPNLPARTASGSIDREVQRHDPLHCADGDPRVHEVGRRVAREARPVDASAARHGRRADQSRGVDVVPRGHRRQALPDRGHLVADRDRRIMITPLPGDATKPGSATLPFPASWRRSWTSRASAWSVGGGLLVSRKPWPAMLRTI